VAMGGGMSTTHGPNLFDDFVFPHDGHSSRSSSGVQITGES
jgi:hypothetical protein